MRPRTLLTLVTLLLFVSSLMVIGASAEGTRAMMKFTTVGIQMTYDLDDIVDLSGGVVTGADPNYYVHGDVTIQWGDTLEVKPGQNVYFDPECNLTIRGSLKAVGTSSTQRDIVFTYNSSLAEHWNGIIFEETSNDEKCHLRYCQISYANRGVETKGASPLIEDCTITQCKRAAIDLKNSECRIMRNTFS